MKIKRISAFSSGFRPSLHRGTEHIYLFYLNSNVEAINRNGKCYVCMVAIVGHYI